MERPLDDQVFITFLMESKRSIKLFSSSGFISCVKQTPRAFIGSSGHLISKDSDLLYVCERTVERYIFKFLANGDVKPESVGRKPVGGITFAPRKKLIVFAYQIKKPKFLSVVQSSFDNCHSSLCPTTFFEISVYCGRYPIF